MRELAAIFRALADETRLQMLGLILRHGELCVCDFVQVLKITQSKASRHLRYLLHAGLLSDRRDAVWVHYRIADGLRKSRRDVILETVSRLLPSRDLAPLLKSLHRWLKEKQRNGACAVTPHLRKRKVLHE